MMDLGSVKKDFSVLLSQIQPWTLSHFVMWLDIKVAEYKVFGRMIMDNTPTDTPQWLRASADYLEQQHKEAQAAAVNAGVGGQPDKDMSPPAPPPPPPPLSPRSAHTIGQLRPSLPVLPTNSIYEPVTSFATSASSLYTVSTVNTTVASPSISPAYTGMTQSRAQAVPVGGNESFQKQPVPISSPDLYAKSSQVAPPQFPGYHQGLGNQRIPPISHLSPKHIRQSHMDCNLSMSLPVSLTPVPLNKDMLPQNQGKESLSTAEVETQIAVLESQIAAVNRSLKHSAHTGGVDQLPPALSPAPVLPTTTGKSGRRKAQSVDAISADDLTASFVPPPYPKKARQQSPISASRVRTSSETPLPPLHSSMDMLARMHNLDTEHIAIPESLRSQNIQSTLEAFEALRTQTFPPNSEALRTQIVTTSAAEIESVQSMAQDMSLSHHTGNERDQMAVTTVYANTPVDREQTYTPVMTTEREQTYTPTSADREAANAAYNLQAEIQVKVEAGQSDEDSMGMVGEDGMPHPGDIHNAHGGGTPGEDNQNYAVYVGGSGNSTSADEKLAAEISTKKMRRKFLESMKNSNPKYYSHQIQQIIPFPDKFPVSNLDYGLKALQMIQTGEITRAGKIQLIDTIFHELIKYTGLYPTPTQKMAVANSIVETFPTLAAKMKASHISPADSWYVILCDKFRNERRGLGGAGVSPRIGKGSKMPKDMEGLTGMPGSDTASLEATEEATIEVRTTDEEFKDEMCQVTATPPPTPHQPHTPVQTTPSATPNPQQQYHEATTASQLAAYHHAYPTSQPSTTKEQQQQQHVLPDMTSEEDEAEDVAETEKILMNSEERRMYTEKVKRSVRRKTHSPKRVQKADTPILDERYAASLLEYYSKHKPYYPGMEGDFNRTMDMEGFKANADNTGLVIDDKGVPSGPAVTQAIAQAVASSAVSHDEPYSAEVAAIVQSVVSAHMDEVLAARNYHQAVVSASEGHYAMMNQPQEVEGTVEVKTSKKKSSKVPIQQNKEKTPEQQQVNLQRFKQKLAITYPGVQAVDDATLLCTCGTKVKLGRARMLHNYTNYHLKRCQNVPITARHESHSPNSLTPSSIPPMYMGSPGEINIPTPTGPKVITKEVESVTYSGLSAADKESIQKHFLLNIPVPTSESLSSGTASSTPTQSLDLTMPVSGHNTLNMALTGPLNHLPIPMSSMSGQTDTSLPITGASDLSMTVSEANVLMSLSGQSALLHHPNLSTLSLESKSLSGSVTVTAESYMMDTQSLDLTVQSSGPSVVIEHQPTHISTPSVMIEHQPTPTSTPSVLIEHQPGPDLRMQIAGSIATSIAEYSGELPDLSAMNALALIQGKSDQSIDTMETEPSNSTNEEPINLADS